MYFQRKYHYFVGDHHTIPPASANYAFIVFPKSENISLLEVVLNNLQTFYSNIVNTYFNDDFCEKVWFVGGDGFDKYKVWKVTIMHVMDGLESTGASWMGHLP